MSTSELKEELIKKIQSISDKNLLLEASRLLEIQLNDIEEPYMLSEEMNQAIDEAIDQIEKGEVLSHKEANKEIREWLEK